MKLSHIAAATVALMVAATPAHAQLLHYYNFNVSDPSTVFDVAGSANGMLGGAGSVSGGALHLGGYDSPGWVDFTSQIVPNSGNYTVSFFASAIEGSNGLAEIISQGSSGGPGFYMGLAYASTGLRVSDAWGSPASTFYQDGTFHNYTLTMDTFKARLYIDGIKVDSTAAFSTTSSGWPTAFGKQFGGFAEYYKGDIDDVRIYGNTLSDEGVLALSNHEDVETAPEPSSLALLGTAFVAAAAVARRRRRQAILL